MRVLLAIAHYFRAEENSRHASTNGRKRDLRAAAIRSVIDAWRGHLGPATSLNVQHKRFEPLRGLEDALDIAVLVNGDNHLLDTEHCAARSVRRVEVALENPRFLGFAAHRLFADVRHAYDMFVFTEDDLRPSEGGLLSRIMAFQEAFGWRRLLLPNRYEWNPRGPTLKTFIDGDLKPDLLRAFEAGLPDDLFLYHRLPGRTVVYRRATNPHSGFFAITAPQLAHWISQPHFGDQDASFISPLESAATLGMLKTFPIYKPFGRDAGWLEVEHLDSGFSSLQLPYAPPPLGGVVPGRQA